MTDAMLNAAGIVSIAVGGLTAYKAGQRRHRRTNEFGVERAATYWDGLRARAIDRLLTMASVASIGGGITALAWTHLDTWGSVVIAPTAIVVLFALLGS